ncbi:natural killer cell receptor 2B4 [Dromiciops gliroides]|uniref:natural killer cell receptor 2B4 n=1 Tax=Dromiciops gliroides TaxID=33562 RepID=UPI001CC5F875|nr:natural killer cell receptor 2B4 [Dromiciops gliroides]
MLWKVFTPLLFLIMLQNQGISCFDKETKNIYVIMGNDINLQPKWNQQDSGSWRFIWFVQLSSTQEKFRIVTWTNRSGVKYEADQFKERANLETDNLSLYIGSVQKKDSGLYHMEITGYLGEVSCSTRFHVSVFDPVQDPQIEVTGESWNNTLCNVNLSCFVHGNSDLTYMWYKGKEQIKPPGKHGHVELHIHPKSTENFYTCNASNPANSRSHTINLTRACDSLVSSPAPELWLLLVLGSSVIPLIILLLSILVCLYIKRKRKRKQIADTNLTFYQKVSHDKPRRNQVQNCGTEQGNTIYSEVQFPEQLPASSSTDEDKTVYSTVQFSKRQPSSKKMNPKSSHSATIYQEVQKPKPLSSKELEIFHIYF